MAILGNMPTAWPKKKGEQIETNDSGPFLTEAGDFDVRAGPAEPRTKGKKNVNHQMRSTSLLTLSTLLAAATLAVTPVTHAAPIQVGQTGGVPVGANQALRVTVNTGTGNDTITVRFVTSVYAGTTNGGIWKTTNISQTTFGPVTVLPSEAASIDIAPTNGIAVQATILSNNSNVHVTGEIIDAATGEVQGIIAILIGL
jgi:hypothetical protein